MAFLAWLKNRGFNSVFVSDHFQPWKHPGGHAPYSLSWLGGSWRDYVQNHHGYERSNPHFPISSCQRAKDDTRHWPALALSAEQKMSVQDPLEMDKLDSQLSPEKVASRWIVSADPEEQVETVRPYIELGFRHLIFHAPGADQERFLRLYATQVLPQFCEQYN